MKIAVRRALPRVSARPFLQPPQCRGPRESDARLLLTAGEDFVCPRRHCRPQGKQDGAA
jgi:hypothetical protein